jgi:hypothetical protein
MPATNELLQEGRYRISQPASGDGNVFEAYDTVRNTTVLVHEFPVKLNKVTTLSQQESMRLAFASQAKALSEIEHESLLHVQDYFSEIDRQFLVMESVEGDDLKLLMDRNKRPFSVTQVLAWADQILDALSYLHARKPAIIHRNVQPHNLRLQSSGGVKLIGVGLATGGDVELATNTQSESALRYSPMEQIWPGLDAASQKVITNSYDDRSVRILKEPLDARSDIYSLGATLYFLMTGIEPVDPLERSIDMLEGKLDPLREPIRVDAQIPAEISDVLMKALEIKRENRYDSAFIMREVLKTAVARVEERHAEDAREQEEAAEFIRNAAQAKVEAPAEPEVDQAAELAAREAEAAAKAADEEAARVAAEEAAAKAAAEEAARVAAEEAAAKAAAEEAAAKAAAEAQAETVRQEELMQQQLRQAEQERLRAEQEAAEAAQLKMLEADRAAEAERAREQTEAESAAAVQDESLLEIPVSAEVVAYRDNPDVDENELAAVLQELEEVERESLAAERGEEDLIDLPSETPDFTPSVEEAVVLSEDPVDMAASKESYPFDDTDLFAETERKGFSLPIPAVAGAIGLVVVIAVGGWFAMSGSSEPPPKPVVEVAQPQPQEATPASDAVTSTQAQTDSNTVATTDPSADQQAAANKPAPAKPKKADPAKDQKAKKAVTVDDLINDN